MESNRTATAGYDAAAPGSNLHPTPSLRLLPGAPSTGRDGYTFVTVRVPPEAPVAAFRELPFVVVVDRPLDLQFKAPGIPIYNRRFSVNELRAKGAAQTRKARPLKKAPPKEKKTTATPTPEPDSETESSDYSSDEYEEQPLPSLQKDHFAYSVAVRVIESTWSPAPRLDSKEILEKLRQFNGIAQELQDALAAAQAQEKTAKDEAARKAASDQKIITQKMRIALQTLIEHGHEEVVECLPQHIKLLGTLRGWLVARIAANDYNGPLPLQILKLLADHMVVPAKELALVKLDKVLARYSKRDNGDETTKPLAKKILDKSAGSEKDEKKEEAKAKDKKEEPKPGTKREREPEAAVQAKRQATQVAKEKKPIAATTGNVIKPKLATAPPKAGAFSHLKTVAAPAKPAPKSAPVAPAGGFSFSAAMASLNKEKQDAETVKAAPAPVETPEQKKKRLRREARGNMRVRFKEGAELEAVKLFHSDAAERAYRRMGGSLKNSDEGKALKAHNESTDEDDERENEQVSLRLWNIPLEIEFGLLEPDIKLNYISRGGPLLPDSDEKRRIDSSNPSLAFSYESRADLPAAPGEAPDESGGGVPSAFGAPTEAQQAAIRRALATNPNPVNDFVKPLVAWDKPKQQDFSLLESTFARFGQLESTFAQFAQQKHQPPSQPALQPSLQPAMFASLLSHLAAPPPPAPIVAPLAPITAPMMVDDDDDYEPSFD